MGQSPAFFVFSSFPQFNKMKAVCLGLKPGAAGWKSQPNPLNYGGTPHFCFLPDPLRNLLFKSDVVVCMTVNKHNLLDETFFPTKNFSNQQNDILKSKFISTKMCLGRKIAFETVLPLLTTFFKRKKTLGQKIPFKMS